MRTRTLITIENALKGTFLGLLFISALRSADIAQAAILFAFAAVLLLLTLTVQSFRQRSPGKRSRRNLLAIAILAVLDHPTAVYVSIVVGYLIGSIYQGFSLLELLAGTFVGVLVGGLWDVSLRLQKRWARRLALLSLGAAVGLGISALLHFDIARPVGDGAAIAATLITGIVLFYVLAFSGRGEETEPEIALICAGLAVALAQLDLPYMARGMIVLIPMAVFVVYCERIRRNLVVFKHVLRGLSHEQQGDLRNALLWYRAALQRNPQSELAVSGNWRVHRKINLADLASDQEIIEMIDPTVCLERARDLLKDPRATDTQLDEASKMLDIVEHRRSDLPLIIGHERMQLAMRQGDFDRAVEIGKSLARRTPPEVAALPDHELDALFRIWSKLLQESALVARGGPELIRQPDYRFAWIATIEGRLRQAPGDDVARSFKPFVYETLTLSDCERYLKSNADDAMEWLDYRYCRELAGHRADDAPERAIELLKIAEMGLPGERTTLWEEMATLAEGLGRSDDADDWRHRVKELGLQIGPKSLKGERQKAFYRAVRRLAEKAMQREDWPSAIENYQILGDSPHSGVATLKTLKELYEKVGDNLLAIRPVEAALQYDLEGEQKRFWIAEKTRLYSLATAEAASSRFGEIQRFFDFSYCYRRAKRLFEENADNDDVIRYLDLAALGGDRFLLNVNYLLGRTYYRQGNDADAGLCLEQVVGNRPERFADSDQEEAYFAACRLLGDIYLDRLDQPEKAVDCYSIYKDYSKSGAETLFRLGRAYEATGKIAHARKWYDMVLVYPHHERAAQAKEALERLERA